MLSILQFLHRVHIVPEHFYGNRRYIDLRRLSFARLASPTQPGECLLLGKTRFTRLSRKPRL